ncbi:GGDEF domain-containing protein [Pseudomonas sp. R5(2019)]|uniref:GGDEF domain-containing protein n=1 Tax=Pseudomonas sp. R5(2019) TaxID=2697566 RepID=UPI001411FF83|nr:GGDEF domain-containing protein [Pseudomonas sp. R5(2019)]NBA96946.1 diguanylate cyclase [Pseudomonas sp. R5(2019)]
MTDEALRWKEKYLQSIEDQEKLERRWEARLDLLRRGLVRSTLAAEGVDRAVDQCMKEMREVVRIDNMDAALSALIPRLERTVLDSEQRRETRVAQVASALSALVSQLQALPLSSDVSRPLKKFSRQVELRASQSREIPLLLGELSGLQGQALASLTNEHHVVRPGLLQRLFGAREAEQEVALAAGPAMQLEIRAPEFPSVVVNVDERRSLPDPLTPVESPELKLPDIETPPADVAQDDVANSEAPEVDVAGNSPDEGPYSLPDTVEPSYSSVAVHIEETLLGLLDELNLPENYQPQAQSMRSRLEHGLNWYELLPILDDLAVLMLAINDSGQQEFQVYLKQLNERLESFQSHLQEASEGHADNSSVARELNNQLREQVDGLQTSVQDAADLDSLKQVLERRLEGLLGTMDEHQQQRDRREQEVAARLQGLAERVTHMEQEAQGYREHLEEQRQKALIDPLTGLANRAAWTERLEQEVADAQQNGSSLLLAILDLDHFKRVNDSYGHLAGDKVLKIVANELRKRLRPTDFIARFGGEEFVLLMPATAMIDGMRQVERLRLAVQACPFHFKGEPVTITVSIGMTGFRVGERSELAFQRADQALYRAKDAGRNQVEPA